MPAIPWDIFPQGHPSIHRPDRVKSRWAIDYGQQKMDFLRHYKFTIAAEGFSKPGYITEKLLHPLLVGSVPIYWGALDTGDYFNPDSFINCHDFENLEALVNYM